MKKHLIYLVSAIIAVSFVFVSCSEDENGNNYNGNGYYNGGDNGNEPPIERRNTVIGFDVMDLAPLNIPGTRLPYFKRSITDSLAINGIDTVFKQLFPHLTFRYLGTDMADYMTSGLRMARQIDTTRVFGRGELEFGSIYLDAAIELEKMGFRVRASSMPERD